MSNHSSHVFYLRKQRVKVRACAIPWRLSLFSHLFDPVQLPHSHIHRLNSASTVRADTVSKSRDRSSAMRTADADRSLSVPDLRDILDINKFHIKAVLLFFLLHIFLFIRRL